MEKLLVATDYPLSIPNSTNDFLLTLTPYLHRHNISSQFITPSLPFDEYQIKNAKYIHIATSGMFGLKVRSFCVSHNIPFTTGCYETTCLPYFIANHYLSWFHNRSYAVSTCCDYKINDKTKNIGCGVDKDHYHPFPKMYSVSRPAVVFIGNIADGEFREFVNIRTSMTKLVVASGHNFNQVKRKYKKLSFYNKHLGAGNSSSISQANIALFLSNKSLSLFEYLKPLSCGIPVVSRKNPAIETLSASHRKESVNAVFINDDIQSAIKQSLLFGDSEAAQSLASKFPWENCARLFLQILQQN